MKRFLKVTFWILSIFLIFNGCSRDSDKEEEVFLEGKYKVLKVTSEIPVDYNADGVFETDLTPYFTCNPSLTFQKNGTLTYPSINISIRNYSVELYTGYLVEYETPFCEAPQYSATYTMSSDLISMSTEWGDQLTFQLRNGILISNFNFSYLAVDAGNGRKMLKRVSLEFQYSKN